MNSNHDERRYQVFISSTYRDLQEERQEVIQALLELDCFPAGMELFPASDDERWELIKSVIDDSDFYIVVVGGRYGSVDEEGISYTEREYDYAVESGMPVLGFVHEDPGGIAARDTDQDSDLKQKLDAFRAKVQGRRMCKSWSGPEDLGSKVSRSLIKAMKGTAAVGWVRADQAMTSEQLEELAALRQRLAELELEKERARTSGPADTEQFAQGDDEVELAYQFEVIPPGHSRWDTTEWTGVYESTWDETFRAIGPLMFDEATEVALHNRLNQAVEALAQHNDDDWPDGTVKSFAVSTASFDQVKVQLVALRLIEKSERRKGVHDRNTYWRLTPFGETYTMSLLAVPRGERATVALAEELDDEPGSEAEADD